MAESVNDMHHFKVTAITQTQYFINTRKSYNEIKGPLIDTKFAVVLPCRVPAMRCILHSTFKFGRPFSAHMQNGCNGCNLQVKAFSLVDDNIIYSLHRFIFGTDSSVGM